MLLLLDASFLDITESWLCAWS